MDAFPPAQVFLAGLGTGLCLLSLTTYRSITPSWLRWLLVAAAALMAGHFVSLLLFSIPPFRDEALWAVFLWGAGSIGLSLPAVFAIDQLLQHPAMTPKKLLLAYMPFLVLFALGAYFECSGYNSGRYMVFLVTRVVFTLGVVVVCALLVRRQLPAPTRFALVVLLAAHAALALNFLLDPRTHMELVLISEMLVIVALWNAFDTASSLRINR